MKNLTENERNEFYSLYQLIYGYIPYDCSWNANQIREWISINR